MIFKINPSFVRASRLLDCLSVCLFIAPIWSRMNFTPLFVPSVSRFVNHWAAGRRSPEHRWKREEKREEAAGGAARGTGFVFLSLPPGPPRLSFRILNHRRWSITIEFERRGRSSLKKRNSNRWRRRVEDGHSRCWTAAPCNICAMCLTILNILRVI